MKIDREAYVRRVRQEVLAYSGPTFLNMDATITKSARRALGSFRNGLMFWATLGAVLIAFLAIFAPLGASYVDRYLSSREQMEEAIDKKLQERYETRLKELSDEIAQLRQSMVKPSQKKVVASK